MLSSLCNSFEDRAPVDSSTGARSSNELQWLDLKVGHQESSHSHNHQEDTSYYDNLLILFLFIYDSWDTMTLNQVGDVEEF